MTIGQLINGRDGSYLKKDERTAELSEPTLVRVIGSTAIFTNQSSEGTGKTYYIYIKFSDFLNTAKDRGISLRNAINFAITSHDVWISSTDPSDVYWAFRYIGTELGASYFDESRAPTKNNTEMRSDMSKHSYKVLLWILDNQDHLENTFYEYYRKINSTAVGTYLDSNHFYALNAQSGGMDQISEEGEDGAVEVSGENVVSEVTIPDDTELFDDDQLEGTDFAVDEPESPDTAIGYDDSLAGTDESDLTDFDLLAQSAHEIESGWKQNIGLGLLGLGLAGNPAAANAQDINATKTEVSHQQASIVKGSIPDWAYVKSDGTIGVSEAVAIDNGYTVYRGLQRFDAKANPNAAYATLEQNLMGRISQKLGVEKMSRMRVVQRLQAVVQSLQGEFLYVFIAVGSPNTVAQSVSQLLWLTQSKAHLIKRIPNLTDDQRNELIDFFNKYEGVEKGIIDWNKLKTLTYDDFKPLLDKYQSGTSDLSSKFNGTTCKIWYDDGNIILVSPSSYADAVFLDSSKAFGLPAKWCIGWERSDGYWRRYVENGSSFLCFIYPKYKTKFMIQFDRISHISIWRRADSTASTGVEFDQIDDLLGSKADIKSLIPKVIDYFETDIRPFINDKPITTHNDSEDGPGSQEADIAPLTAFVGKLENYREEVLMRLQSVLSEIFDSEVQVRLPVLESWTPRPDQDEYQLTINKIRFGVFVPFNEQTIKYFYIAHEVDELTDYFLGIDLEWADKKGSFSYNPYIAEKERDELMMSLNETSDFSLLDEIYNSWMEHVYIGIGFYFSGTDGNRLMAFIDHTVPEEEATIHVEFVLTGDFNTDVENYIDSIKNVFSIVASRTVAIKSSCGRDLIDSHALGFGEGSVVRYTPESIATKIRNRLEKKIDINKDYSIPYSEISNMSPTLVYEFYEAVLYLKKVGILPSDYEFDGTKEEAKRIQSMMWKYFPYGIKDTHKPSPLIAKPGEAKEYELWYDPDFVNTHRAKEFNKFLEDNKTRIFERNPR